MGTVSGILSAASSLIGAAANGASAAEIIKPAQQAYNNNAGIHIGNITNARVYLNSGSLMGMAEKVDGLGAPKIKMNEYKALGLHSGVNLPGGFEQPDLKISWNSLYADLAPYLYNPMAVVRFQILGAHEHFAANGLSKVGALQAYVNGMVSEHSEPSIEGGTPVKAETTFKVTYAKLILDGIEQYEYDVFNNVYKVGGVDIFSIMDQIIGG